VSRIKDIANASPSCLKNEIGEKARDPKEAARIKPSEVTTRAEEAIARERESTNSPCFVSSFILLKIKTEKSLPNDIKIT